MPKGVYPRKVKISDQQRQMAAEYQSRVSVTKIARRYNVCESAVLHALKKLGIPRHGKRHFLCETVFDEPLTDAACYWVGFLMADGCITYRLRTGQSQPSIHLCLASQDLEHVQAFRSFLGATHRIRIEPPRKGNEQSGARFSVASTRLVSALARFGVVPRKSLTAQVQLLGDRIPFWRGMIDGDGCLGIYDTGPRISLLGPLGVIEPYIEFLKLILPSVRYSFRLKQKEIGLFMVDVNRHDAADLASILYPPICSPVLSRKHQIAQQIIHWGRESTSKRYNDWSKITAEQLIDLYRIHRDWKRVGEVLGMPFHQIYNTRNQLGVARMPLDYSWITPGIITEAYERIRNWRKVGAELNIPRTHLAELRQRFNMLPI